MSDQNVALQSVLKTSIVHELGLAQTTRVALDAHQRGNCMGDGIVLTSARLAGKKTLIIPTRRIALVFQHTGAWQLTQHGSLHCVRFIAACRWRVDIPHSVRFTSYAILIRTKWVME